jgi:hypothetical protein
VSFRLAFAACTGATEPISRRAAPATAMTLGYRQFM